MTHFDFKEWADLYQVDPVAFEQRREAVLEGYVATVDTENRLALEQTLFKIRMVRQRSKSPLQSALESSKLMWESFGKLREHVQNGLCLIDQNQTHTDSSADRAAKQADPEANLARVIPFTASGKRAR